MKNPSYPRIIPFAVFMAFIGIEEVLGLLHKKEFLNIPPTSFYFLYPLKACVVTFCLFILFRYYTEIQIKGLLLRPRHTLLSIVVGLFVFVLWIQMDWSINGLGVPQGFNPGHFDDYGLRIVMIFFRLFGAVIVVPIMEELFWRSFLIRYIINNDFISVPQGTFTWASFLISSILFGFEHHYVFAGVMAGMTYNLLLYHTKSVTHCIAAHATTNLALGVYVITTGAWHFW